MLVIGIWTDDGSQLYVGSLKIPNGELTVQRRDKALRDLASQSFEDANFLPDVAIFSENDTVVEHWQNEDDEL